MKALETWHHLMASQSDHGMWDLLHPECTFWSPVVHTPQRGRDITYAYLSAAKHVFNTDFRYVREVVQGNNAVLEFECMMDNIAINGVDMLTMDEDVITDFKVMVRPLKAVNKVHEKMMAMLEQMHPSAK